MRITIDYSWIVDQITIGLLNACYTNKSSAGHSIWLTLLNAMIARISYVYRIVRVNIDAYLHAEDVASVDAVELVDGPIQ